MLALRLKQIAKDQEPRPQQTGQLQQSQSKGALTRGERELGLCQHQEAGSRGLKVIIQELQAGF